jgi:hypothetical protein
VVEIPLMGPSPKSLNQQTAMFSQIASPRT